jgi:hypothetical protein
MSFCTKCGTENEDQALYCKNCGTKIKSTLPVKQSIINIDKYKEKIAQLNKLQIMVIAEVICLFLVICILLIIGIQKNTPEAVAQSYFKAYSDKNWSKVYGLMDHPEGALFQKPQFIEQMKNTEVPEIINFEIIKEKQSAASIQKNFTVEYTVKGEGVQEMELNLMKQKEKTLLFFDTWKVFSDQQAADEFSIYVPEGTVVAVDGITLDDSKKIKSKTAIMDKYNVSLFIGSHKLQAAVPWFEVSETEFSAVQNGEFILSELKLTEEGRAAIQAKMQEALEKVYRAAMKGEDYTAVSSLFLDKAQESGRESYDYFAADLREQESYTLNQAVFTDFQCEAEYGNDNQGMIGAELTFNYETQFTVTGHSWWGASKTEEKNGSGSSFVKASFGYDGDTYKLTSISFESILQ